ncbi:hypothetical protein COO60DRAFT_143736 [Scenedesmus sp. NREL 46B-D3]|nr:hypothetical protein COO60DRAFT_143736 [Scenedesmus sp. NREL 46B-D3]
MASAQPAWSWQETQALLARLSQPSAAALRSEYANARRLAAFLNSDPSATHFDQLPPGNLSSTLLRWCSLAAPFLQVLVSEADQVGAFPAACRAVSTLVTALGMCLESWLQQTATEGHAALRRRIAQHTAGLLPVLSHVMDSAASQLAEVSPRHRAATAGAATASLFRDCFPMHSDVCMAAQLLGFWEEPGAGVAWQHAAAHWRQHGDVFGGDLSISGCCRSSKWRPAAEMSWISWWLLSGSSPSQQQQCAARQQQQQCAAAALSSSSSARQQPFTAAAVRGSSSARHGSPQPDACFKRPHVLVARCHSLLRSNLPLLRQRSAQPSCGSGGGQQQP